MPIQSPEGLRLYDRIMVYGIKLDAHIPDLSKRHFIDKIMENLRSSMVFNIQNVADYYFIQSGKKPNDWTPYSFPNIAPPYQAYFMEYRVSRHNLSGVFGKNPPFLPRAVGILTYAEDLTKTSPELITSDERWHVKNLILLQWDKHSPAEPSVLVQAVLDKMGKIIGDGNSIRLIATPYKDVLEGVMDREHDIQAIRTAVRFAFPGLLATTFLHCKGVTITQENPDPGLAKAHQKRHGQSLVKFHTLAIRPMQEVLRRAGDVEQEGLKRALHIVRGHFADYTEGRGLFGKHQGIFWMPQHLRGTAEQGITLKDYDVKNPPSTPSI